MARKKQQPAQSSELWSQPWPMADQPLQLELGDLSLNITRHNHEWQLAYQWQKNEAAGLFECSYLKAGTESPLAPASLDRVAMQTMSDALNFRPRLADRPVVVRPYSPLVIPGKNRITLYVSTPLWLSIDFSPALSRELPLQQLSDTWMGSLTGRGELCYGSHTHARLDRALLLSLPYRAITPISIHNRHDQHLTLERLSIPTEFLSLYEVGKQIITEPLVIAMDSEKQQGIVQIGKPEDANLVSSARKRAERGVLVSAWENLFA